MFYWVIFNKIFQTTIFSQKNKKNNLKKQSLNCSVKITQLSLPYQSASYYLTGKTVGSVCWVVSRDLSAFQKDFKSPKEADNPPLSVDPAFDPVYLITRVPLGENDLEKNSSFGQFLVVEICS